MSERNPDRGGSPARVSNVSGRTARREIQGRLENEASEDTGGDSAEETEPEPQTTQRTAYGQEQRRSRQRELERQAREREAGGGESDDTDDTRVVSEAPESPARVENTSGRTAGQEIQERLTEQAPEDTPERRAAGRVRGEAEVQSVSRMRAAPRDPDATGRLTGSTEDIVLPSELRVESRPLEEQEVEELRQQTAEREGVSPERIEFQGEPRALEPRLTSEAAERRQQERRRRRADETREQLRQRAASEEGVSPEEVTINEVQTDDGTEYVAEVEQDGGGGGPIEQLASSDMPSTLGPTGTPSPAGLARQVETGEEATDEAIDRAVTAPATAAELTGLRDDVPGQVEGAAQFAEGPARFGLEMLDPFESARGIGQFGGYAVANREDLASSAVAVAGSAPAPNAPAGDPETLQEELGGPAEAAGSVLASEADRVQDEPQRAAEIGAYGAVGAGALFAGGPQVRGAAGRAAGRTREAGRAVTSAGGSGVSRATTRIREGTPNVQLVRDPDAGLVDVTPAARQQVGESVRGVAPTRSDVAQTARSGGERVADAVRGVGETGAEVATRPATRLRQESIGLRFRRQELQERTGAAARETRASISNTDFSEVPFAAAEAGRRSARAGIEGVENIGTQFTTAASDAGSAAARLPGEAADAFGRRAAASRGTFAQARREQLEGVGAQEALIDPSMPSPVDRGAEEIGQRAVRARTRQAQARREQLEGVGAQESLVNLPGGSPSGPELPDLPSPSIAPRLRSGGQQVRQAGAGIRSRFAGARDLTLRVDASDAFDGRGAASGEDLFASNIPPGLARRDTGADEAAESAGGLARTPNADDLPQASNADDAARSASDAAAEASSQSAALMARGSSRRSGAAPEGVGREFDMSGPQAGRSRDAAPRVAPAAVEPEIPTQRTQYQQQEMTLEAQMPSVDVSQDAGMMAELREREEERAERQSRASDRARGRGGQQSRQGSRAGTRLEQRLRVQSRARLQQRERTRQRGRRVPFALPPFGGSSAPADYPDVDELDYREWERPVADAEEVFDSGFTERFEVPDFDAQPPGFDGRNW